MNNELAPVVMFVYARQDHTLRTLKALRANQWADQTDLIIFSDAPRGERDVDAVNAVRNLVKTVTGFKSIRVVERKENYGLAKNIQDGVSEVCQAYGRVIILEDDIVTSPTFLKYMNCALEKYKKEPRVWHISAWNYPIEPSQEKDAFFLRIMNCWGWGTWSDRWVHYKKCPDDLVGRWDQEAIRKFNVDGHHDFWSQILRNQSQEINTWAVFWYATIFENSGLCLNPCRSLVQNIGNDGSGTNCGNVDLFNFSPAELDVVRWPEMIAEDPVMTARIQSWFTSMSPSLFSRIFRKLKTIVYQ